MRILLAIDDSKFSDAATRAVIAQAPPKGSQVRVLHVVETVPFFVKGGYGPDVRAILRAQSKQAKALVARAARKLRAAGLKVSAVVESGHPKIAIINHAAKWRADVIVIGSHGRRGLQRFLLGSVSEAVARHARCSVQIVRMPGRH